MCASALQADRIINTKISRITKNRIHRFAIYELDVPVRSSTELRLARFNNLRTRMPNQSSTWFNQELCLEIAGNAYSDEHPITHLGDV